MCVGWHPFSHVVSRWRLHTHLHCGLIASTCPRIRPRMISNIVLHSHVGKTLSSKTNCWAKAWANNDTIMIRISNYKYILQQAPKNKASTYTKLLQSRPARPSGRSTSKENSIRSPYNSFTFFSGKYVPKHGFGDMLKKSVTQILDSHIIQFSNRSLKQLTSLPIKKAPFHRSSRSLAIAHWLSGHPKRKGLSLLTANFQRLGQGSKPTNPLHSCTIGVFGFYLESLA